jgi:hypothetical protein
MAAIVEIITAVDAEVVAEDNKYIYVLKLLNH